MNIVRQNTGTTVVIPINQVLSITTDVGSSGSAVAIGGDGVPTSVTPVPVNQTVTIGPFNTQTSYRLFCDSGTLNYCVGQIAFQTSTDVSKTVKNSKERTAMNKCGMLGGASTTGLSNGTETGKTYRQIVVTPKTSAVSGLRFMFANWNVLNSGEVDGTNDITIEPYFEYNSIAYPITFQGKKTATLNPGCSIKSDPLGQMIPANAICYVRTYVSVSSGQWPLGRLPHTGSGEGGNAVAGTTGANVANGTGALAGNQNVYMYGPINITGDLLNPLLASVGYVGDSIGVGSNDTVQTNGYFGWIERALDNNLPWVSNARSNTKLNDFNTTHFRRMAQFQQYITSVIMELVRNDIASDAVALSVAQSRAITGWKDFSDRGIYVFGVTCTPTTTAVGSDWLNGAQTPAATEAVRVGYNTWLRDGAPMLNGVAVATGSNAAGTLRMGQVGHPLTDYIDVADACESARNSGIWRIDLGTQATADGVHPVALAHAQIALKCDISKFK